MLNFKGYISEMYNFFPNSAEEIDQKLSDFPEESKTEILSLFNYLNKHDKPINIDMKKPNQVNVSRVLDGDYTIQQIRSGAGLQKVKIKFGNGSSGNRGANNRGNAFEPEFANAMNDWWSGEKEVDAEMLKAIQDLDKTYNLTKSKKFSVSVDGGENTRRPLMFGSKILLDNPKGKGYDVGKSVTDLTVTTDKGDIYLSLKLGGTTTFFNVGVKTIMTRKEIESGLIQNKNGLKLLNLFGIDNAKFCAVFNGTGKGGRVIAKPNAAAITDLLKSGIGHNYHIIHKMGKKILSKQMDVGAMNKAAKVSSVTIYYGGKTGKGKRVDMEMSSATYNCKLNIRDTQGKDGYPSRLMCDFKYK